MNAGRLVKTGQASHVVLASLRVVCSDVVVVSFAQLLHRFVYRSKVVVAEKKSSCLSDLPQSVCVAYTSL